MRKSPARKSPGKSSSPGGTPRARGGFLRTAGRWLWTVTALIATVVFALGLPVRLTVRDSIDRLAVIYYAAPWPVLAFSGALAAWYWRRWHRTAIVVALLALGCTGAWVWKGFRFSRAEAATAGPSSFRISYWNLARPGWRLRGLLPMAAHWHADVLCFGESRPTGPLSPKWAEAFPDQRVQPFEREMLMVGPADAERLNSDTLNGAGQCHLCTAKLGGREVFILLVDFDGEPLKTRAHAFERLYQLVDAYATKPLIVLGDFNTPGDSVYFDRLRTRLTDAFDAAGRGPVATWPMFVPVLSLDHILVNKYLRVVRCEHHTSLYSDHWAVVADLAWK